MITILIALIHYISLAFSILLIAKVVLSYFMDRYHPVKQTLDRIVDPILDPIRRVLPQTGFLDFSPVVAIILVQILEVILTRLLIAVAG
jgi:YggT family protein